MYEVKNHPLVEELDHSLRLLVFKKLKKLQSTPELGEALDNKKNLGLSGMYKVYVAKKKVRIVYIIAIGKREEMEVYKKVSQRR